MLFSLGLCTLLPGCNQSTTKNVAEKVPLIPRKILFSDPEKTNPKISSDGKQLAYIAQANGILNVWVKTIGLNDDRPIIKGTNGVQLHWWAENTKNIWWANNNKYILCWRDKDGDENCHIYRINIATGRMINLTPFDNVRVVLYAASKKIPYELLIGMNKKNKLLFDVYSLNIETGDIKFIEKNPGNIEEWIVDNNFKIRAARAVNKDGSITLLTRNTEKDIWQKAITWPLEGELKFDVFGFSKDAGFSPDNKKLYLHDARKSNTAQFIEYEITTGNEKVLAQDSFFDASKLICDSNKKPLAVCFEKERRYWLALDTEFKTHLKIMLSIDDGDLSFCNCSNDNQFWIICFTHDNRSTSYYIYDKKTQKATFLFYAQPELNKYKLPTMEPISFIARDGLKIHGYLTCPLGKLHKNLPLILKIHGGPWGRDEWGYNYFNTDIPWLTNRGYACLQINYRGSNGYGKAFLNAGNREWGAKMHDDLIDAANWAIAEGIADPKKIAITGVSYGGYAALVGATFTPDVFCCAAEACGPSNLITTIKSFMPYMVNIRAQFRLRVGDPEKDTDFLKSRSPLFKVANIKIPILIGQGANDVRVKQEESEQIIAAMKAKGLPFDYVLFSDEGHGFIKPENRLIFYKRIEKFFAKHLGGRYEE